MAGKAESLAKLTRPRLHAPLPRPRLFQRLDTLCEHRAIWLSSPPGAGKTTLVGSYLDDRKLDAIWFQVDAGDIDLASFFYYLGLATPSRSGRHRSVLPALRPEYLSDLKGFTRRFFRSLFAQLPTGHLIVFDNVQHFTDSPQAIEVLTEALAEIPEGHCVVLVSRVEPPNSLSRFVLNRDLGTLAWDEIRLDLDEARSFAVQLGTSDMALATKLHSQSDGWAAGLVLMLEQAHKGIGAEHLLHGRRFEQVFDYFADQVLSGEPPEDQEILLQLSLFPRITTALAQALTGRERAGTVIERLFERHLFVSRRRGTLRSAEEIPAGPSRVYEFHALFRQFLLDRAGSHYSIERLNQTAGLAARLLEAQGAVDDAVPLFQRSGEWSRIEEIVVGHAESMITQGRWKSVLDWTTTVPEGHATTNPWFHYWRGVAEMAAQPAVARTTLERAYELGTASNNDACRMQAAAAIVETYYFEYSHFIPLDRWIPVLRGYLEAQPSFETIESELRVWLAFLDALMVRPTSQDMLETTIDKVFELANSVQDLNLKASAARTLILCCTHTVRLQKARSVGMFVQPLLDHPDVLPVLKAMTRFALSWFSVQAHEYSSGMAHVAQMERLAADQGMPQLARLGHYMGGLLELFQGRLDAARERAELMERTMFANHPYDVASNLALKAWIGVVARDPAEVMRHIPEAIRLFDQVGSSLQRQGQRNPLPWALVETGRYAEAEDRISEALAVAYEVGYERQGRVMAGIARAYSALKQDDTTTLCQQLRTTLAESLALGQECWLQWHRSWMPELCREALRYGIETNYVCHLIRTYGWPAPDPEFEDWPWRIRVRTLGKFSIEIDGVPLAFGRKVPRKVLALLKAVIGYGGRQVPQQKILDALWPDEEADDAQMALTAALRRLRSLLVHQDAILHTGKELTLSESCCWVDVWAFERALQTCSGSDAGHDEMAAALYRGSFLEADTESAWAVPMRERLRGRFIGTVETAGRRLEQLGHFDKALERYRAGLQADDLVEGFYAGQMRCLLALDRPADALGTYRRMRQLFSVVLGIEPSRACTALRDQALQRNPQPPFTA